MDREQEEVVQRITARYVEEVRSGRQPDIGDYLARYPQFAEEIANYIAYYHAFEADLPGETPGMPVLSEQSQEAINTAWGRIVQSQTQSTDKIASLLEWARELHLDISQLADKLGISVDIAVKLEEHAIDASTIPRRLVKLLAEVLQQPLQVIQAFLDITSRQQLAEAQTRYRVDGQVQSFRDAIEESTQLAEERRRNWIEQLDQEQL
jgi:hypothetical protein